MSNRPKIKMATSKEQYYSERKTKMGRKCNEKIWPHGGAWWLLVKRRHVD